MSISRFWVAVLGMLAAGGCRAPEAAQDAGIGADASQVDYPPPNDDLVTPLGTDNAIDIATWNLENFPQSASAPSLLADLIASLELDLVAVQEIQSEAAFAELVARLDGFSGVLSAHTYGNGTYQKVGFIYRESLLSLDSAALLFQNNGYEFPRPPLQVRVSVEGGALDFTAIAVHYKAGFGFEDRERREDAAALLEGHVRRQIDSAADSDVLVIGDFNDTVGSDSFAPWENDPVLYTVHTEQADADGDFSFIPSKVLLDHAISTASLSATSGAAQARIRHLDQEIANYSFTVSDHLPVFLSIPRP